MEQTKEKAMFALNTHELKHARGFDSWQALAGEGCGRHFTLWEKQTLKKLRRDSLSPSSRITKAPQQQALSDTNHTKCPLRTRYCWTCSGHPFNLPLSVCLPACLPVSHIQRLAGKNKKQKRIIIFRSIPGPVRWLRGKRPLLPSLTRRPHMATTFLKRNRSKMLLSNSRHRAWQVNTHTHALRHTHTHE